MRKAASLGISLSEETITEITLYNIAMAHQNPGQIAISIATKPQEKLHGADWEWWLVKKKKNICYRVQAKRLFPNGQYSSLYKTPNSNKYAQLDTLVAAAKASKAVPMYCFYNFDQSSFSIGAPSSCLHSYRGPSYWGCSLAAAPSVRNTGSNDPAVLKAIMRPWHLFACSHDGEDLVDSGARFASERLQTGLDNPALNIAQSRSIPAYVERLLETRRPEHKADSGSYVDVQYWNETDEKDDLAGIAVFDDTRTS